MNKAHVWASAVSSTVYPDTGRPWAFEADGCTFWQWRLAERGAQWESTAAGLPLSGFFHSAGSPDISSSEGGYLRLGSLGSSFKGK